MDRTPVCTSPRPIFVQDQHPAAYTDAAKDTLIESGFSEDYGARPLKDTIEERIATPLSEKIISGEIGKGAVVEADWNAAGNKFIWTIK